MNILKNTFFISCFLLTISITTSAPTHKLLAHEIDAEVLKMQNIWGCIKLTVGLVGSIVIVKLPELIINTYPPFKGMKIHFPYQSAEDMNQDPLFHYFWKPYLKKNMRFWVLLAINGYEDINFPKISRTQAIKYLQMKTKEIRY